MSAAALRKSERREPTGCQGSTAVGMDRRHPVVVAVALAFVSLACSAPSTSHDPNAVIRDEPPLNLGFTRSLPADWTLVAIQGLLLAVPPGWSEGAGTPRVFTLQSANRDTSMR